jgi:hypothetical protein
MRTDWIANRIQQCSYAQARILLKAIADEFASEKLAGILATVTEIEAQREREGARCRRKVTDKQRFALATALLEKYGTAREIVKAGWGMTDQEIDEAEA